MPFVALPGRGDTTVPVLKVLRMCGLARSDRAALNHWRFREVYVDGERMDDKKAMLKINVQYTLEIRPINGGKPSSMDIIAVEYPYPGYLRGKIIG